jgi:outer membrane protein
MKQALKKTLGVFILAILVQTAQAQKIKLGHVNTQEIMQQLIEKDSIEQQLEQLQVEMQKDLQKKQQTLNKNYQEYLAQKDSLSKMMVKMKEEALREQQQQLEVLPQQYEQAFQNTQAELIEPIKKKVEGAIKKVASANLFTYVFDSTTVLFTEGGIDITDLVRTELALPKPVAKTAPTSPLPGK